MTLIVTLSGISTPLLADNDFDKCEARQCYMPCLFDWKSGELYDRCQECRITRCGHTQGALNRLLLTLEKRQSYAEHFRVLFPEEISRRDFDEEQFRKQLLVEAAEAKERVWHFATALEKLNVFYVLPREKQRNLVLMRGGILEFANAFAYQSLAENFVQSPVIKSLSPWQLVSILGERLADGETLYSYLSRPSRLLQNKNLKEIEFDTQLFMDEDSKAKLILEQFPSALQKLNAYLAAEEQAQRTLLLDDSVIDLTPVFSSRRALRNVAESLGVRTLPPEELVTLLHKILPKTPDAWILMNQDYFRALDDGTKRSLVKLGEEGFYYGTVTLLVTIEFVRNVILLALCMPSHDLVYEYRTHVIDNSVRIQTFLEIVREVSGDYVSAAIRPVAVNLILPLLPNTRLYLKNNVVRPYKLVLLIVGTVSSFYFAGDTAVSILTNCGKSSEAILLTLMTGMFSPFSNMISMIGGT